MSLNLKPQSFGGETDYGSKMKECFRLKSQRFVRSFFVFRNLVSNSDKSLHVDKGAKKALALKPK